MGWLDSAIDIGMSVVGGLLGGGDSGGSSGGGSSSAPTRPDLVGIMSRTKDISENNYKASERSEKYKTQKADTVKEKMSGEARPKEEAGDDAVELAQMWDELLRDMER